MSALSLQFHQTASYDAPFNFEELLRELDEQCKAIQPSVIEQFSFELDGVTTEVRRVKQANGDSFIITATLGHLPFSIESAERRNSIRTIIGGARGLPTVRFGINYAGKINAGGVFDVSKTIEPDFIFYPLTLFLQEARPFIQLICRYL